MKIDIPKEWLKASIDDLKVTVNIIINNEELSYIIAFHIHQSIEKSFKALIEYKNLQIPKQYNLIKLTKLIKDKFDIQNNNLLDTLNKLWISNGLRVLPYNDKKNK